jgi:hypothetical protein
MRYKIVKELELNIRKESIICFVPLVARAECKGGGV